MNILNKRNRGFTLIEILIVLVILAGIVVMLTKGTMGGRDAARANQTKIDMQGRIKTAIISMISLKGKMVAAADLTEASLGVGTGGLLDPFGESYTFTVTNNVVTITPGAIAVAKGVPNVDVDCTPYF
ncbi:MAG: type II secretion system GspH family protein [Puniceicoccales bacterium]|jgi:prepilin-type N-terminal cleavage/methylation domain-containing protein|nr:type II secretion system GspH family protein [Puniceicoccales bacterium]